MSEAEHNPRLYLWYTAFYNAFFWMPVFFLYFGRHLSMGQVLQLESIYYAAVVLLELPSGYFSDTFGRRRTLLGATGALVAAYLVFVASDTFAGLAAAQVLLAAGISFNSGTDTSFHYDALASLDRAEEYGDREARAARNALTATSAAALAGGAAAALDLRLAYALSAVGALGAFVVAWQFTEPEVQTDASTAKNGGGPAEPLRFDRQVLACLGELKRPALAWLFGFAVFATVVNHLPYEFYQPYLDVMAADWGLESSTPLGAGVHMATAGLLGAFVARRSEALRTRFGTRGVLLSAGFIQIAVVAAAGLVLSPWIVLVLLLRGVPGGLIRGPLNAAVTPKVQKTRRATYLSLQSLAGRLSFSVVLLGLSAVAGGAEPANWEALSRVLLVGTGIVGVAWVVLAVLARKS